MHLPVYSPVHNWRNANNKNNLYKIHIRVHLLGEERYYEVEIPRKVRPQEWTGKDKSWVKNTHPFSFEINEKIKEKLDILDKLVKRYYNVNKNLSFDVIGREIKKKNNTNSFIEYFDEYIKNPRETVDEPTIKRYRASYNHLKDFAPKMTFNELSDVIFQEFKKYLEQEKKLLGSTINGYFNAIKTATFWARKDNHITKEHEESIWEDVHIKINKSKKEYLEVDEVLEWINFVFTGKSKKYERDRDMFQLLIYSGYYYNDLRELWKAEFKRDPEYGHYLYSERFKNDSLAIVPLWKFPKALTLIEKYRDPDPESPYLLRRDCFLPDQTFNKNLKAIAKLLNWKRNIYNKLGRKTNSQLYIRFGAARPVVSKMMGHEKEETTSAYFDVNIKEIIEGTKNVDFTNLGI